MRNTIHEKARQKASVTLGTITIRIAVCNAPSSASDHGRPLKFVNDSDAKAASVGNWK